MDSSLAETLNNAGIDLVNWTKDSAISLLRVLETEAPLLLEEWIAWNFWSSLIWFGIGIVMLVMLVWLFYYTLRPRNGEYQTKYDQWYFNDNPLYVFTIVAKVLLLFFVLIATLPNTSWMQIVIAPRVWILENIVNLIK